MIEVRIVTAVCAGQAVQLRWDFNNYKNYKYIVYIKIFVTVNCGTGQAIEFWNFFCINEKGKIKKRGVLLLLIVNFIII